MKREERFHSIKVDEADASRLNQEFMADAEGKTTSRRRRRRRRRRRPINETNYDCDAGGAWWNDSKRHETKRKTKT